MMEWIRPVGISLTFFFAFYFGKNPVSFFHILGTFIVLLMNGTVAFEALHLGDVGSAKIGYVPNRAYQIQSGLANLAIAIGALMVLLLKFGREADATIVIVMLSFFLLSGANHLRTIFQDKNYKIVNLMRPVIAVLLTGILIPYMIKALTYNPL